MDREQFPKCPHDGRMSVSGDVIGGFPVVEPDCKGCGKPLLIENAWMTDGCPCNSPLGINSMNETRWRLLMQLQQSQARQLERRVAMLEGRIRVLVDDKQVTLPGRIEGYMLKAAAGSDPHRTTWKRMPVGAPEMIVHDTTILDLVDGDEFWTSPPATFG